MECAGYIHQRVLQDPLHAGGAIGVALSFRSVQINRFVGISRRTKQFDEARRITALCSGMKFEKIEIERECAIGRTADQLANLLDQGWSSVASQAHDFVFVLIYF